MPVLPLLPTTTCVTTGCCFPTAAGCCPQTLAGGRCSSSYVQKGGYCRATCGACPQGEGAATVQAVQCDDVPTPDGVTCDVRLLAASATPWLLPLLLPALMWLPCSCCCGGAFLP